MGAGDVVRDYKSVVHVTHTHKTHTHTKQTHTHTKHVEKKKEMNETRIVRVNMHERSTYFMIW